MSSHSRKRAPYQLKERAVQMEATRRKIAAAAVELHATVGPTNTTISAIAERAGVERVTVYRHFPDDRSLFAACVDYGVSAMPLPDPAKWRAIPDAKRRVRTGLRELYAYFERTETMWSNVLPALAKLPALVEANQPVFARFEEMSAALLAAWPRSRGRARLRAAIGHALDFHTYQSLVRGQGLSKNQAVELMTRFIDGIAGRA